MTNRENNESRRFIVTIEQIWDELRSSPFNDTKFAPEGMARFVFYADILGVDEIVLKGEIPPFITCKEIRDNRGRIIELDVEGEKRVFSRKYNPNKKVIDDGEYWVDENNNKWSKDEYLEHEALILSYLRCDHCGKVNGCCSAEIWEQPTGGIFAEFEDQIKYNFDLCPDCAADLLTWIKE